MNAYVESCTINDHSKILHLIHLERGVNCFGKDRTKRSEMRECLLRDWECFGSGSFLP